MGIPDQSKVALLPVRRVTARTRCNNAERRLKSQEASTWESSRRESQAAGGNFGSDIEYHVTIQNTQYNIHSLRKKQRARSILPHHDRPTSSEVIASTHATANHGCRLQSLSCSDLSKTNFQTQTFALTRAFQWHNAAASITPIHQCRCFSARSPNKYTSSLPTVTLAISTPEV